MSETPTEHNRETFFVTTNIHPRRERESYERELRERATRESYERERERERAAREQRES